MKRLLFCLALLMIIQSSPAQTSPLPYDHFYQLRRGLPSLRQRLTVDKTATIAFLGGSITYNPGWRDKICSWFTERFPETKFHFIAAGIPSLGSPAHAFRLRRDVLDSGRVDLMFVETAVNDRANGTDSLIQCLALEGIVHHALKNNPAMDLILMSFADPEKNKDYLGGLVPVETKNQERVAARYHLPSINLDREVSEKIRHGEFSWEKDFKDLHPAPFGQELYAVTMIDLLTAALSSTGHRHAPPALAAPLSPGNFSAGEYVLPGKALYDDGWKLDPDWTPADGLGTREGFVHREMLTTDRAGAALSFSFTGNAVGIAIVSGADAGIILYLIDRGAYQKLDLFTPWSSQLHLPWYLLLGKNLPRGHHVLNLKMSPEKNKDSRGNVCRIVYFLVNH